MLNTPIIKYEEFIKEEIKEENFSDVEYDNNDGTIHNIPLTQQDRKQEIIKDETKSNDTLIETIQLVEN